MNKPKATIPGGVGLPDFEIVAIHEHRLIGGVHHYIIADVYDPVTWTTHERQTLSAGRVEVTR